MEAWLQRSPEASELTANVKAREENVVVKNKRALITGSARGIGKEMAILFAREGADIVLNDIIPEEESAAETPLKYLTELIKSMGRRCIYVYADVSKHEDVTRLVNKVVFELGGNRYIDQ